MTPLRALSVTCLLACTLGFQAVVALPPNGGSWWWPFLDYPMYASPRSADEEITFRRLEGVPCDDGPPVVMTNESFGIRWHTFDDFLDRVVRGRDEEGSSAQAELRALAREKHDGSICLLRIHQRSVRLGALPRGGPETIPWRLVAEVSLQ